MAHKDLETLADHGEPAAPSTGQQRCSLVIYHRDVNYLVPLYDGNQAVLGRDGAVDICINDRSLSRQHACFSVEGAEVWVEDLESTNGTRKNGEPIKGRVRFSAQDELRLGSVTVALHVLSAPGTRPLGLQTHDRWMEAVLAEETRGRFFSRKFGIITVRSLGRRVHLWRWCPRVRQCLRVVDQIAMYSEDTAEILLPEIEPDALRAIAKRILEEQAEGEPPLVVGLALFPDAATTAEAMVETARAAARRARPDRRLVAELKHTSRAVVPADTDGPVLASPQIRQVYQMLGRVAPTKMPILIQGETGSGKEIVAQAIHQKSKLKDKPMVAINCGAIPPQLIASTLFGHVPGAFSGAVGAAGLFESANGGTIFLDEVGELPSEAQAALLRVLEDGRMSRVGSSKEIQVSVRLIAATHRDLEAMVKAGEFRQDLYYRLERFKVEVPPLRDRPEDIEPLVHRFMERAAQENELPPVRIEPGAMALLLGYAWPGNIRELKNVVERAVVIALDGCITMEDLPSKLHDSARAPEVPPEQGRSEEPGAEAADRESSAPAPLAQPGVPIDLRDRLKQYERQLIIDALNATQGVQAEAAKRLNMPLRTLSRRMSSLGIRRQGYGVE